VCVRIHISFEEICCYKSEGISFLQRADSKDLCVVIEQTMVDGSGQVFDNFDRFRMR
jgi:hypothetical protein